jgi:hypothetical protein
MVGVRSSVERSIGGALFVIGYSMAVIRSIERWLHGSADALVRPICETRSSAERAELSNQSDLNNKAGKERKEYLPDLPVQFEGWERRLTENLP